MKEENKNAIDIDNQLIYEASENSEDKIITELAKAGPPLILKKSSSLFNDASKIEAEMNLQMLNTCNYLDSLFPNPKY